MSRLSGFSLTPTLTILSNQLPAGRDRQRRCCSRRSRNGDVGRSRAGQVNAFCNVCVNSHLFLSFFSFSFFPPLCDSLWAPCHQLQMFSPTKLLTSICGQEKTGERGRGREIKQEGFAGSWRILNCFHTWNISMFFLETELINSRSKQEYMEMTP